MTTLVKAPSEDFAPAKAKKPKKRLKASHVATYVFIALMLVYPLAHFLLMWLGVNINSILLTFKTPVRGKLVYVLSTWNGEFATFFSTLFKNYINLFNGFNDTSEAPIYANSLAYFVVSCLVTLPIAMLEYLRLEEVHCCRTMMREAQAMSTMLTVLAMPGLSATSLV